MYIRALLFKRYSRLAALYSILETGRQPSFGGSGFAKVAEQASNDPVMTNATRNLLWGNDMRPPLSVALRLHRQLLQQRLRILQITRLEPLREPPVNRGQQFAR